MRHHKIYQYRSNGDPGGIAGVRKIPEETIAENFPSLIKNLHVQKFNRF